MHSKITEWPIEFVWNCFQDFDPETVSKKWANIFAPSEQKIIAKKVKRLKKKKITKISIKICQFVKKRKSVRLVWLFPLMKWTFSQSQCVYLPKWFIEVILCSERDLFVNVQKKSNKKQKKGTGKKRIQLKIVSNWIFFGLLSTM